MHVEWHQKMKNYEVPDFVLHPPPQRNNNLTTTHNWHSLWESSRTQLRTAATQWTRKSKDGHTEKYKKHFISIIPLPNWKHGIKRNPLGYDLSPQGKWRTGAPVAFADARSPWCCTLGLGACLPPTTMHTCAKDAPSTHFYST